MSTSTDAAEWKERWASASKREDAITTAQRRMRLTPAQRDYDDRQTSDDRQRYDAMASNINCGGCSCHISAPCSRCEKQSHEEDES